MATPLEKGNALESAVAAIEKHILDTSPALREKTFFIEGKKIITVDGVHHEIDFYVTIDLGAGYRSVFIFECKNWQDPVGKNESSFYQKRSMPPKRSTVISSGSHLPRMRRLRR